MTSTPLPQRPLQALIDGAAASSTVRVPAGIYREQITINKPITLLAEPGAEIRGSDVWTGWTKRGGYWVKPGLPDLGTYDVPALAGSDGRCNWPEQVIRDGQPLRQVRQHPGTGQFAVTSSREVVLADDPSGHLIEVTTRMRWIVGAASDVTIGGFRMRHAASPPQRGAIDCTGFDRWTIRDNVLSDASGAVVFLAAGSGHQLLRNEVFNGGQEGLSLSGVRDSRILSNHVHDNNTEEFDPNWEAGGMKISHGADLTIQQNTFNLNLGAGLWFDIDSTGARVLRNLVHHNTDTGIAYEISERGLIQGNACWENGWRVPTGTGAAGIFVNSSKTTQVLENVLGWNPKGIMVMSQHRSDGFPSTGITVARNVIASSDDFVPGSRFGLCWYQDYAGDLYRTEGDNHGDENRYWYTTPEGSVPRFRWTSNLTRLSQFNQTLGEHDGRYLSIEEKDQLLAQAGVPLNQEQH
ncbi:MAG TPA: right-handed parallel beta-helix repeat-containing protein [Thermomicrobiaceae bacterium]|nr:right-handed parallel beta-helix repeat-containing protein [Thermomicrobiaceae bacterium]